MTGVDHACDRRVSLSLSCWSSACAGGCHGCSDTLGQVGLITESVRRVQDLSVTSMSRWTTVSQPPRSWLDDVVPTSTVTGGCPHAMPVRTANHRSSPVVSRSSGLGHGLSRIGSLSSIRYYPSLTSTIQLWVDSFSGPINFDHSAERRSPRTVLVPGFSSSRCGPRVLPGGHARARSAASVASLPVAHPWSGFGPGVVCRSGDHAARRRPSCRPAPAVPASVPREQRGRPDDGEDQWSRCQLPVLGTGTRTRCLESAD